MKECLIMRNIEELVQHVRSQGGKVTSQRLLIWQALANNHAHPTAEDLYAQLKPILPGLSLTTLYSALNELVEWGEVRRFDTGDGHIHFDPDISPHAELICMRCHSVIDVPGVVSITTLPSQIAGYRIITCAEQYYGYCPACQTTTGN
jgi:Fur family transcriptional regulator, peroxide stress response regulator